MPTSWEWPATVRRQQPIHVFEECGTGTRIYFNARPVIGDFGRLICLHGFILVSTLVALRILSGEHFAQLRGPLQLDHQLGFPPFDDGSTLNAGPDEKYEEWEVVGPDGLYLVGKP